MKLRLSWQRSLCVIRHYSKKNDRITCPDDLACLPVRDKQHFNTPLTTTPASTIWESNMDPIGGGRSRHARAPMKTRQPNNDKRRKFSKTTEDGSDHVYGVSPVYIALLAGRRDISEAFIQEGLLDNLAKKKKDPVVVEKIVKLCEQRKIPTKELSKHDLNMLTDSKPHQGLVLRASALSPTPITSLPRVSKFKCVLALDEVTDPQNLGALIRSFHFLSRKVAMAPASSGSGIHNGEVEVSVVLCQKNSAPLSPAVSKASSGALENMTIHSTRNMMKFLEKSTENGWHVVGTSSHSDSRSVTPLHSLSLDRPVVIVLGNEGHGVRKNILNRCESLVAITSKLPENSIGCNNENTCLPELELDYVDSLNVSVCGGIILHHILLNSTSE